MRRYDDPVDVRRGWVPGGPGADDPGREGPVQFRWRGRPWQVRAVHAHWVETGAWWQTSGARAVLGTDDPAAARAGSDLLAERELWRVEAGRGSAPDAGGRTGVFDLSFTWSDGSWQLVGCLD